MKTGLPFPMKLSFGARIAALSAVLLWILAPNPVLATDSPDFQKVIRPLLSDRCLSCHGPDAHHREADLRLDDFESMTSDRGGYSVVVPGKPSAGELVNRITSDDPDLVMPPPHLGKALSSEEVQLLKQWIVDGAELQPHWAYVMPKEHPTPQVKAAHWPNGWIDEFILQRLEQEGLSPSPDADAVTLIRRLYLDLTGLPPTPEEVAQFLVLPSEAAYEQLVDRLLRSDAHAERLTIYWLDLVRYADTVGYHGDQDHNISPYRDWVIEAFADNKPFDEFTMEQLAGDLLPDATIDQKVATGYNRLLQTSHEGGLQPKEYLSIYAADRVRNVSAVWMGATVGCAQCHDHKYDPYTAKDFYALGAFFADLDEQQHFKVGTNSLPTKRPPEIKVLAKRQREQLEELKQALKSAEANSAGDDVNGQEQQASVDQLKTQVEALEKSARLTMISVATTPREMRVLPRGDWLDETGPLVQPEIPEFLGDTPRTGDRATRRDLARWICDTQQGSGLLTARVFANRFWYLMMGQGLSGSLADFGGQGEPPEHPELLDRLAMDFASDWNIRRALKQIVMSRTYRQSSDWNENLLKLDPQNRLFARQSSYRLPAEMIRDAALKVSGLLVQKVGGPSVKPYQPAGYYRHLNFPVRKYKAAENEQQWRRGVYVHWQRQFLHPMMKAFDAPSREECTAARPRSNTPLAALTLLNDPTFVEASRALAESVLKANSQKEDRQLIDRFMLRVVSRPADDFEAKVLLKAVESERDKYTAQPASAAKVAGVGLAAVESANIVELASWTTVARTLLNLDEAMTRN